MTIITQVADEFCQHPAIWLFSWDDFGVVVLRFYLVATPEQSSHHVVLCTRLVATNISIVLQIEKALLVLFAWIIVLSNRIIRIDAPAGFTMITIYAITEL